MLVGIPLGCGHNKVGFLSLSLFFLFPLSFLCFFRSRGVKRLARCGTFQVGCPLAVVPPQSGWARSLVVRAPGACSAADYFLAGCSFCQLVVVQFPIVQ